MQRTIEGAELERQIIERGYAEFDHAIPADEVDAVITHYTDFTTQYPDMTRGHDASACGKPFWTSSGTR